MNMLALADPTFVPGSVHNAVITFTNTKSVAVNYTARLLMVNASGFAQATSGLVSFSIAAGSSKDVTFNITMPDIPGIYTVWVNVYVDNVINKYFVSSKFVTVVISIIGALYGRITDINTGYGIDGIKADFDGIVAYSGSGGYYSYAELAPGTYYGVISDPYGRYYSYNTPGIVVGGGNIEFNIQLTPTGIPPALFIPYRGKFASPWNGEKFDTIEELIIDGGGCSWTGDPYYLENWNRTYTRCPYCGMMFDYTWREDRPVGDKREECLATLLAHINNTHRLICTSTGEDFTWSAKVEDRYDLFTSECVGVFEPYEVEVVPLAVAPLWDGREYMKENGVIIYVDNFYDASAFFEGPYWSPNKLEKIAGYYPYLYKATQIVEGPMYLWRRIEEGGNEGVNMKYCGKWGNYNRDVPGCGPSGLKLIIPGLADKNWICYVDNQNGINIVTLEGSGSVIKWRGELLSGTQGLVVRIEFDDQCLVIFYPYASWGAHLGHHLVNLERAYAMSNDGLNNCKDCLINIYNTLHGVPFTYAPSETVQSNVYQGGMIVLDRSDCKITYKGYGSSYYYYCNWTPSEVNNKYNQKKPVLDSEYAANVAKIEALQAKYEANWEDC